MSRHQTVFHPGTIDPVESQARGYWGDTLPCRLHWFRTKRRGVAMKRYRWVFASGGEVLPGRSFISVDAAVSATRFHNRFQ